MTGRDRRRQKRRRAAKLAKWHARQPLNRWAAAVDEFSKATCKLQRRMFGVARAFVGFACKQLIRDALAKNEFSSGFATGGYAGPGPIGIVGEMSRGALGQVSAGGSDRTTNRWHASITGNYASRSEVVGEWW